MNDLFAFDWGVDQDGYELANKAPSPLEGLVPPYSPEFERELERGGWKQEIRRRGGPLRYYRPMERPGLWRRLGEAANTRDGIMAFVGEFGLLGDLLHGTNIEKETLGEVANTARILKIIGQNLDSN